jgi:hypothetical protein
MNHLFISSFLRQRPKSNEHTCNETRTKRGGGQLWCGEPSCIAIVRTGYHCRSSGSRVIDYFCLAIA